MGRDIDPIKISGEDRRNYRAKLTRSLDVLARMLRERRFEADPCMVGQEIELNLVDEHGAPSMRYAGIIVAASDEQARLLELFEIQNDEGPCRDCYRLGAAVVIYVIANNRQSSAAAVGAL